MRPRMPQDASSRNELMVIAGLWRCQRPWSGREQIRCLPVGKYGSRFALVSTSPLAYTSEPRGPNWGLWIFTGGMAIVFDFPSAAKACCVCLCACVAAMAGLVAASVIFGDVRRLTHGFDYNGRLCGVDAHCMPSGSMLTFFRRPKGPNGPLWRVWAQCSIKCKVFGGA